MREFFENIIAPVAAIGAILTSIVLTALIVISPVNYTTSTVVEIGVSDKTGKELGHGSGSYIGGGYYLTAAHVAEGDNKLTIKLQNGTVLQVLDKKLNADKDVAILFAGATDVIPAANLFCGYREVGTNINAKGYPMSLGLVHTEGKIVSSPSKWNVWESVYRVDAALGPGMSGGPVFDRDGYQVGITVGVALMPVGDGASTFGVNLVVPSVSVCEFLYENQKQELLNR